MAEKIDFEKAMAELEQIVEELERGDLTLEEALKKFERGLEIGKQCREILDRAEARVKKVITENEGEVTEKDVTDDFEQEEND